jgi:hypothetical protein
LFVAGGGSASRDGRRRCAPDRHARAAGTYSGTTKGLPEKHGKKRVFDMLVAENAMTGVALGSCLVGMRPIMTHMRLELAMTVMDQICNQAAKWHYMFGGRSKVSLTLRMLIGRGWGQGPQHSQSLHAWFAHVIDLRTLVPRNDAATRQQRPTSQVDVRSGQRSRGVKSKPVTSAPALDLSCPVRHVPIAARRHGLAHSPQRRGRGKRARSSSCRRVGAIS